MAPPSVDGLVVVDKPAGLTSHDVVARVRKLAGQRKVGHAGTLDPMATGVLVLGLGRATRLLGYLAQGDKTYVATVRLGATTVTDDAEGEVVSTTPAAHLDEDTIRAAAATFVGVIDQVPSSVSAVKIDGRRAHSLVRSGEEVVIAARTVTISELLVSDVRVVGDHVDLDITVTCSSGTYVRAIARDLGELLGVGGHLTALRRTRVGAYDLAFARTLEQLAESFEPLSLDEAVGASFPRLDVDEATGWRIASSGRAEAPAAVLEPPLEGPIGVFEPRGVVAVMEVRRSELRALVVLAPSNARSLEG